MAMKYCTQCGNKYPNDMDFCTVDGAALGDRSEAETLRMHQGLLNITQISKTQWMDVGDYLDFETPKFNLHIILNNIVEEELPLSPLGIVPHKQLAAQLSFEIQGLLYGGSGTKRLNSHEYLLPVGGGYNQEFYSIFLFYLGEERVVLFRAFVKHINPHARKVELDIAYFRYPRA